MEHNTDSWDEIGARFHHRLVFIHPFPNGNGRHARLMTDVLMETNGQEAFTWGQASLEPDEAGSKKIREQYLTALREADGRKFEKLMKFIRS
ncbi:MAG: Fic family protein [Bdellovibrionales bacterium]|nr:Fic family protein [Bdellovibrionales bacterium]